MKSVILFLLNLPFTLAAIIPLILSFPHDFKLVKNPLSFVFKVKSFWWGFNYLRYARAITISHIIFLGPRLLKNDLEHEIIHVKQFDKYPLIFPMVTEKIDLKMKHTDYQIVSTKVDNNS